MSDEEDQKLWIGFTDHQNTVTYIPVTTLDEEPDTSAEEASAALLTIFRREPNIVVFYEPVEDYSKGSLVRTDFFVWVKNIHFVE